MSKSSDIAALFDQYVMPTYAPSATLVRGRGCKVWNADGMVYLDFTAGIAVQNAGHSHPRIVQAIQEQAAALTHVSNLFYTANQALLAQRLSNIGLGGKCFFANSGAEANEGMIKLARLWGAEKGKYEVICMQGAFHGRTLATIAATGQSKVQQGFDPLPLGFVHAEYNDLDAVKALINERTVGIMVEAVQGEGGVVPATPEFMTGVRELCDSNELLMMCDEVQCGMGRTGHWFGFQAYDVTPDLCTLAKALGSGIPIGAVLATPEFSDVLSAGKHATTFGGNPLACAAALATIDVIEGEKLVAHAKKAGELLKAGLTGFAEKYETVLEVRGAGLMLGMVVECPAVDVVDKVRDMGLLVLPAGEHVVRFLPPLNVTEDELEEALDMVDDALDELFNPED